MTGTMKGELLGHLSGISEPRKVNVFETLDLYVCDGMGDVGIAHYHDPNYLCQLSLLGILVKVVSHE